MTAARYRPQGGPARSAPANDQAPAPGVAVPGGPPRLSPWFSVIGLLLLATLLAAGFVQARQYALLNITAQYHDDYLVLSLYQAEIDYLRLREQLSAEAARPGSGRQLALRYEIFLSRLAPLRDERANRLLTGSAVAAEALHGIDRFSQHADLYFVDGARAMLSPQAAQALLAELQALDETIHSMILGATHHMAAQVTDRQAQVRDHNRVSLALTASLLAMLMLFALIALRQMRKIDQRQQRLETLADQLRDARIDAEAASDAKSAFLADMSHELRTPLNGLMGMLSLARDAPHDSRSPGWLAVADESAAHLLRLLDDLLDLSKLESGALVLAPQPVHLVQLVREVQSLLQPAAAAKGLGLAVEIDPALPAWVRLDPTRVRQVLFNLLTNATKFSDAGAVVLRCRPAVGDDDAPLLEFDVADTGIGMDSRTLARLFQRFSRADDPRALLQGGTGLGLAISRNLAWLMQGEIVVRSAPGEGSVFSFRCPLHPVAEAPPTPIAAVAATARPLRVLVAEDHPVNRQYMLALLELLGHQGVTADNGQLALQAVRDGAAQPFAEPFDLVLMDVHMPVMDGVAASAEIRRLPGSAGRVCIVALTADVFADTRARCLQAGVDEVLSKPLSMATLQELLGRRFGVTKRMPAATTAPAATTPPPALLDLVAIHNVRGVMGGARVPVLYSSFFKQAEEAAQKMRHAMREADTDALRRSAHMVKGAALNLGLPALAEAAATLNRDAGTLAATHLALALQRFEEIAAATHSRCEVEGLTD